MFTGDTQDILTGIFGTPNRELNASQGRWLSPDPAGSGWNQYGYVTNNPLSAIDPSGLACYPLEKKEYGTCVPFMNNGVNFGESWNQFSLLENPIPVYGWVYGWHLSPVPLNISAVQLSNGSMTFGLADLGFYWGVVGSVSDWTMLSNCITCGGEHFWDPPPVQVKNGAWTQGEREQAVHLECLQEAYNANNGSGASTPAVTGPSSDSARANGAIYQEWNKGANQSPFLANPEGVADAEIADMALIPPQLFVEAAYKTCMQNLTGK
jgi:RHS repeat-associated protein